MRVRREGRGEGRRGEREGREVAERERWRRWGVRERKVTVGREEGGREEGRGRERGLEERFRVWRWG